MFSRTGLKVNVNAVFFSDRTKRFHIASSIQGFPLTVPGTACQQGAARPTSRPGVTWFNATPSAMQGRSPLNRINSIESQLAETTQLDLVQTMSKCGMQTRFSYRKCFY